MKINFTLKSRLGKLSVVLIIFMPIFFYVGTLFVGFYGSTPAGRIILQDIIIRPGVAFPMLTGFICGIAAFFTGILSITRKKDYSILVFLSTIIGFFVLIWCLTEFLFPH